MVWRNITISDYIVPMYRMTDHIEPCSHKRTHLVALDSNETHREIFDGLNYDRQMSCKRSPFVKMLGLSKWHERRPKRPERSSNWATINKPDWWNPTRNRPSSLVHSWPRKLTLRSFAPGEQNKIQSDARACVRYGRDRSTLWLMKMFNSPHLLTVRESPGLFFAWPTNTTFQRNTTSEYWHSRPYRRTRPHRPKQIDDYIISHCRAIGVDNKIPSRIHCAHHIAFLRPKIVRRSPQFV